MNLFCVTRYGTPFTITVAVRASSGLVFCSTVEVSVAFPRPDPGATSAHKASDCALQSQDDAIAIENE